MSLFKWSVLILIGVYPFLGLPQNIQDINLDEIKAETQNITSSNFYPSLLNRFNDLDSTLNHHQLHLLYYGKYFQAFYDPTEVCEHQTEMYQQLRNRDFSAALIYGKKAFEKDPINLKTLFGLSLCHHYLKNEFMADQYLNLYYGLIAVILNSGKGNDSENALVVMQVSDEYEIVSSIGKKVKKQKLINGSIDLLTFEKTGDKDYNRLKKMYFDVAIPLMKMDKGE